MKPFFYFVELEKPQEKVLKNVAPKQPPTVYALQKFIKCHQTFFFVVGLVLHVDMIPYFHCTIFAELEIGTLVAIPVLPTLKIFLPKKKPIRLTLA